MCPRKSNRQKLDINIAMNAIREKIIKEKTPCLPEGELIKLMQKITGDSQPKTTREFWSLFGKLDVKCKERISLDNELGIMKAGNTDYFFPLEMVRIYILVRRLNKFPGAIFYFMDRDAVADDWLHHYELEQWEYEIANGESIYNGKLEGVKVAPSGKNEFIPLKLSGHTPIPTNLPKIVLQKFEVNGKAEQHPRVFLKTETLHKKIFHLQLKKPMKVGQTFALQFQCRWPGQLASRLSYIFTPCIHLRKGVEKEVTKIISDRPLGNIAIYTFDVSTGSFEESNQLLKGLGKKPQMELLLETSPKRPSEVLIMSFEKQIPRGS